MSDDEQLKDGLGSGVDWLLAARAGARLSRPGPKMSDYTREHTRAELSALSREAEGPVRAVTLLADGLPVPEAQILERSGWIEASARSMAALTGGTLDERPAGFLAGRPAGLQAGALLAFLSTAILGQYDPFTAEGGSLLLVAPNIVAVERALRVDPHDFRLWVCLHEVTHRVQFSANPWLGGYMRERVAILGQEVVESTAETVGRIVRALKETRSGEPGPAASTGVMGMMLASQPEAQRQAVEELIMLGTLLEGHAEHVMDAVGPEIVPTVAQIREAFDARRRQHRSPLQRLVRALLGMDAKLAQYVRGKAFVDAVVAQVGMEQFNRIWSGPETLPRNEEIEDPGKWITRVLG
jgi:coenzyme F420 biosynthesis associated uncharacterized protein